MTPDGVRPTRSELSPGESFDQLLDFAAGVLNQVHGTRHGRRYWGILIYRYLHKCLVADEHGVPIHPVPESVADDDDVLGPKVDGPSSGDVRYLPVRRDVRGVLSRVRRWPTIRHDRALLRSLKGRPLGSSPSILSDFHYYHVIGTIVDAPAAYLDASGLWHEVESDPSRRDELRSRAAQVEWPLGRRTLEWMPRYYVEEFRSRAGAVVVESPRGKTIHAAFLPAIETRFYTAHHVVEGSGLAFYQHAGYYGEVFWPLHHAEASLADRFHTWGWKLHANDRPFLALRLMRPAGEEIEFRPRSRDWLYVNLLDPFPWFVAHMLETQNRFFSALQPGRARRIVVRVRVMKGGSAERQIAPEARKIVLVDDGERPWHEALNSAALVILSFFPTTTFLECIHAGIPVVAIVPEGTVFTPVFAPYAERFFTAGVLHRTPEAAAAFLNAVSIGPWWQGVMAEDWLEHYKQTFCRVTASDAGRSG